MTTQETPVTDNVKQMRETIERQQTEIAELKQFRQDTVIASSGLEGVALKAVLKDIERGDYTAPMTPEDLQKYAEKEYDWAPTVSSETPTDPPPNPVQDLMDEGTKELNELEQNGTPPPVKDIGDQHGKAQAEGDHLMAAKLGMESQMDQLLGSRT